MMNTNQDSTRCSGRDMKHYVRLTSDAGFKAVFTDRANKKLLIDFLNTFLDPGMRIRDIIQYLDREDNGDSDNVRDFRCDLKCLSHDDTTFIIEMQKSWHARFFERCIYYGARTYGRTLQKGKAYSELNPVAVFAILGDRMPHNDESLWIDNEDVVSRFNFTEMRTGELAPSSISTIFVELGRFTKNDEDELKNETDVLLFLFKHIHEYEQVPEKLRHGINLDLVNASEIAAFDGVKKNKYESDMINELDIQQYHIDGFAEGLAVGKAEGREQGIKEGKEKGIKEGREEGRTERETDIVRSMSAQGLSVELISKCTGLTTEEILKITDIH